MENVHTLYNHSYERRLIALWVLLLGLWVGPVNVVKASLDDRSHAHGWYWQDETEKSIERNRFAVAAYNQTFYC